MMLCCLRRGNSGRMISKSIFKLVMPWHRRMMDLSITILLRSSLLQSSSSTGFVSPSVHFQFLAMLHLTPLMFNYLQSTTWGLVWHKQSWEQFCSAALSYEMKHHSRSLGPLQVHSEALIFHVLFLTSQLRLLSSLSRTGIWSCNLFLTKSPTRKCMAYFSQKCPSSHFPSSQKVGVG
ncbi:unnamed protein product [Coffea canephora]|uniref:Uncharacterized protein n=1 Tax=Coffea canephora TaxID=49390 RepID=A0A068V9J4_COFCA|nr:unnamed protein product [Coffea canephora]